MKVLSTSLIGEMSSERFAREIRVSARLQHPGIVPVLSVGTADELPYYVMPFVKGETLRARLDRELQLPVEEACFGRPIAERVVVRSPGPCRLPSRPNERS